MPVRAIQYSFNGGEVSPRFAGRLDHARHFSSLDTCLNFVTSAVGGLDRRPGTRFDGEVKDHARKVRRMVFEFSVTQAYDLEVGHGYIRFYRDNQRIEVGGVPVEVTTPYAEEHLFGLQTAQSADVMWIAHPNYPPAKLLRFSETQWAYQVIVFDPPPSFEEPHVGFETLNLFALSGTNVIAIATGTVFLDGDVGRQITLTPGSGSQARATITALNFPAPTDNVMLDILVPFPQTPLGPGSWQIEGPLGSGLRVQAVPTVGHGLGLKGSLVKALLIQRNILAPELVFNGSFTSGLFGWTDYSDIPLAQGQHTGGSGSFLQDVTVHLPALMARVGMRVLNTSSSNSGTISAITPDGHSLATGTPGITFNPGNNYEVRGTGGVEIANGGAQITGAAAGVAWIEKIIQTIQGQTYQLLVDVYEGPVSIQVGASPKASDLYHESTFPIGKDAEVIFTAFGSFSYIQIRNNQPTMSRVTNIRCKNISAWGWRPGDINHFIKVRNGVLELVGFDNGHSANAVVRTPTDEPVDADTIAGAWTLEAAAWSSTRGYPRAISFHQQRLGFAGSLFKPLTIWQSEIGLYENFGASSLADSALEQEFSANTMNAILWAEPFRDLLVGTAAGEHLLRGVNGPLTPSNGEQLPQTRIGSHGLPPIRADNALIILMRGGRQIRELEYDANGAVVRGKDHTLVTDHVTQSGLVQWAFQAKPSAVLWGVRSDGTLIGLTYEQFEQVQGWHRHSTDGHFESVSVSPINQPIDERTENVCFSVRRTINGQTRRFMEHFDPSLTLDCAISYSGPPTNTITGLSHLEGESVTVIDKSNGADQPAVLLPRLVSGGQITGLEVPVTAADVGLAFAARAVTLRPEVQTRNGTSQGIIKRLVKIRARLLNTGGLFINGQEAIFRQPADDMGEGLALRSGDVEVTNFGYSRENQVTLEQIEPLPCTIIALMVELELAED